MRELIFCAIVLFTAGCTPDPLGITERTQIRANAIVSIATQERLAEEAKAKALVDAEAAANSRNSLMLMFIPPTILMIGIVGCAWLWLNWRGRIALERLRQHVPKPLPRFLIDEYKKRGCEIVLHENDWWPVHIQTGRRLAEPARKALEARK